MLPNSSYKPTITLTPKPNQDTTKKKKKREREREKITGKHLMHINAIILSKVFANHTQQYTKRIIYHDQLEFLPKKDICFSIHKSINVKNLYQQRKGKIHMTVSIAAQEAFDKIQHLFMIKSLTNVSIGGTYLDTIKTIYDKPTANVILSGQ